MDPQQLTDSALKAVRVTADSEADVQRRQTDSDTTTIVSVTTLTGGRPSVRSLQRIEVGSSSEIGQAIGGAPARVASGASAGPASLDGQHALRAPLMPRWERFHERYLQLARLLDGAHVSAQWEWTVTDTGAVTLTAAVIIDPFAAPAVGLLAHAIGHLTGQPELCPVNAVAVTQIPRRYPHITSDDLDVSAAAFAVGEEDLQTLHGALTYAHTHWKLDQVPFHRTTPYVRAARQAVQSIRCFHSATANEIIDHLASAAYTGVVNRPLASVRDDLQLPETHANACVHALQRKGMVTVDDTAGGPHVRLTQAALMGLSLADTAVPVAPTAPQR